MAKNSKCSGYYFFVQDMRNREPGWKRKSNKEVFQLCDSKWRNLSDAEKRRYNDMKDLKAAKSGNDNDYALKKGEPDYRRAKDNIGRPVTELLERDRLKDIEEETDAKAVLSYILNSRCGLDRLPVNLIHVNTFGKVLEDSCPYILAEIALTTFTLREGIKASQSFFPRPLVPVGYAYQCMSEASGTHEIPHEEFDDHYTEDEDIARALAEELGAHKFEDCHIVFTREDNKDCVTSVLEQLFIHDNLLFRVHSIENLICGLFEAVGDPLSNPEKFRQTDLNASAALNCLLDCEWHKANTETLYCALAITKRMAYLLADKFCPRLDIVMCDGSHKQEYEEPFIEVQPSRPPGRDDDAFDGTRDIRLFEKSKNSW